MTDYNLMPANTDNFELSFGQLPISTNITDNKKLTLHLFNSIVPGVSISSVDEHFLGWKVKNTFENSEFDDLTVSFTVDDRFENWKLIFQWMMYINNNKDTINSKKDFVVDANMIISDNYNNTIMKIIYIDVFPISMDSIDLSYRDNEEYMTCNCTFAYDVFELVE